MQREIDFPNLYTKVGKSYGASKLLFLLLFRLFFCYLSLLGG